MSMLTKPHIISYVIYYLKLSSSGSLISIDRKYQSINISAIKAEKMMTYLLGTGIRVLKWKSLSRYIYQ